MAVRCQKVLVDPRPQFVLLTGSVPVVGLVQRTVYPKFM